MYRRLSAVALITVLLFGAVPVAARSDPAPLSLQRWIPAQTRLIVGLDLRRLRRQGLLLAGLTVAARRTELRHIAPLLKLLAGSRTPSYAIFAGVRQYRGVALFSGKLSEQLLLTALGQLQQKTETVGQTRLYRLGRGLALARLAPQVTAVGTAQLLRMILETRQPRRQPSWIAGTVTAVSRAAIVVRGMSTQRQRDRWRQRGRTLLSQAQSLKLVTALGGQVTVSGRLQMLDAGAAQKIQQLVLRKVRRVRESTVLRLLGISAFVDGLKVSATATTVRFSLSLSTAQLVALMQAAPQLLNVVR